MPCQFARCQTIESFALHRARHAPPPLAGGRLSDCYARHLLHTLGLAQPGAPAGAAAAAADSAADWAASGLMWLTGEADGPPARAAAALPSCARGALSALRHLAGPLPEQPANGALLLSERAALLGLERRGRTSPNGSCHLFTAADGEIALNLARPDDRSLLCAWLQTDEQVDDLATLARHLRAHSCAVLVERAQLLGLPAAAAGDGAACPPWYRLTPGAGRGPAPRQPLVLDLSSLWAGPLCAQLLRESGARVIKVESVSRPDGARAGNRTFFDLLNGGKQSLSLALGEAHGQAQLRALLQRADIVIDSSRPRALRQFGIDALQQVRSRPGLTWVSITGYGRDDSGAGRVAFGDDAAVAAGLLYRRPDGLSLFCGDAPCDPLTGVHAALAALAVSRGGGGLLDICLHDVAAHCAAFHRGDSAAQAQYLDGRWCLRQGGVNHRLESPRARRAPLAARAAGADNRALLREFALPC
ncbi:MAG: CoA transferase [Halioglobus sp.]|nr:CoA transferase [Halioglobus sp.]